MPSASLRISRDAAIAPVPQRLFGSFVEHMGRSVYTGIYEPGHDTADEHGFRHDVLDLVRELGPTVARYPGGNFVSGYKWEDGVGPVENRPTRLDAAWHSLESNHFGLHEFVEWAHKAGVEVMEAVNLGTRGIAEAAELLEYCNIAGGTALSDSRRANGAEEPFDITLWCLGNEVDGPWQIGHKTADEYGRLAAETARLMRFIDPRVELVAAGSSNAEMPTFGDWERTVLTHTAGLVDHISVHAYYEEHDGDVDSFLASGVGLDRYLETVAGIIDEVAAASGSDRPVGISVDEWNVWYQRTWNERDKDAVLTGEWTHAPRLIEDEYSVTDAVVVGSLINSLLRHSDRVTMANLAQLVNVIAPIRSEPGGPAWRQSTFYPFQRAARAAVDGTALHVEVSSDDYTTAAYGEVPLIDAAAILAPAAEGDSAADAENTLTLLLVNRGTSAPLDVTVRLDAAASLVSAETLTVPDGGDRHTTNTEHSRPVAPVPLSEVSAEGGLVRATLPALSWSIVTLALPTKASS